MSCEETTKLLSPYIDDVLTLPVRATVDGHLDRCPVCRAEVVDLRSLSRSLGCLARQEAPPDLASAINDALFIEAAAQRQSPEPTFLQQVKLWLEPRLMPYSVGSLASVILFVSMFAGLRPHFVALQEAARQENIRYDLNRPVTAEGFSASRADIAGQSPSLHPDGALAVLTSAYSRPGPALYQDGDDMIVVADVFSDGSASLADVMQAPRNQRMLAEFEVALRESRAFVSASLDRRPDTMRVVFTMQKVDVRETDF